MANKVELLQEQDKIVFRDKKYQEKLIAQQEKLNEAITQYNASVDAGENAEQIKAQIVLIQNDIQAISESGLPSQVNNASKALISDGNQTGWQFVQGHNDFADTGRALIAGDSVFFTLATEQTCTYPARIAKRDPIIIENDEESLANLIAHLPNDANYTIKGRNNTMIANDTVVIEPGEKFAIQAISNLIAKVI